MDFLEKDKRGRSREKSLYLDKKRRHKKRSGSVQGKNKKIGNSRKCGCSYCLPSLSIRVYKTLELRQEIIELNKKYCR